MNRTARIPTIGWYRGVEFGDVDRDGDQDMILANDFYRDSGPAH